MTVLLMQSFAGQAAALPPVQQGSIWPNEPSGLTLVSDYGFPDPIPVGDTAQFDTAVWRNVYDASRINGNLVSSNDNSAPLSPPKVLDFVYLQGDTTQAGSAPATVYYEP